MSSSLAPANARSLAPWSSRRCNLANPRSPSRTFACSRAARASGHEDFLSQWTMFCKSSSAACSVAACSAFATPARPPPDRKAATVRFRLLQSPAECRPRWPPTALVAGESGGPTTPNLPSGRAAIASPRRRRWRVVRERGGTRVSQPRLLVQALQARSSPCRVGRWHSGATGKLDPGKSPAGSFSPASLHETAARPVNSS